jgi:hypothetical protein
MRQQVRAILESECSICSISSSLNNQLVLQWDTEARFDIDFVVQNEDLSMGTRVGGRCPHRPVPAYYLHATIVGEVE